MFLVEAGPGCARSGQGANGAMWVVRLEGRLAIILGGPEDGFEGYFYSIEPTASKRYRDIILGFHLGAAETGLGYYRFDSKSYHQIGSAILGRNGHDQWEVIPRE